MIAESEQFSICQSSQDEGEAQEFSELGLEPLLEEDLQKLPLLNRYLSTHYRIFKGEGFTLSSLLRVADRAHLEVQRKAIAIYFSNQASQQCRPRLETKPGGLISSQFAISLQQVPPYSIVYISIMEVEGNRFNMIVRNGDGEWLAFFEKQRKCKKLPKILRILSQIRKPLMAIIKDQTVETQVNLQQINKIGEVASEFLYMLDDNEGMTIIMEDSKLRSGKQDEKEQCCLELTSHQVLISSANLSNITDTQIMDILMATMHRHSTEQSQALSAVRGPHPQLDLSLKYNSMFVNVLRAHACSPHERLFMKQQELYITKDELQRQKQIGRRHSQATDEHFPQNVGQRKPCTYCENGPRRKIKKTSVICSSCSARFKRDIHLCPDCFGDFHQRPEYYCSRRENRRMRRNPRSANGQKNIKKEEAPERCSRGHEDDEVERLNTNSLSHSESPHRVVYGPKMIEKVNKLDHLWEESMALLASLKSKGFFNEVELYKGACLALSLNKMKEISINYPELSTGLTSAGAKIKLEMQKSDSLSGSSGQLSLSNLADQIKKQQSYE